MRKHKERFDKHMSRANSAEDAFEEAWRHLQSNPLSGGDFKLVSMLVVTAAQVGAVQMKAGRYPEAALCWSRVLDEVGKAGSVLSGRDVEIQSLLAFALSNLGAIEFEQSKICVTSDDLPGWQHRVCSTVTRYREAITIYRSLGTKQLLALKPFGMGGQGLGANTLLARQQERLAQALASSPFFRREAPAAFTELLSMLLISGTQQQVSKTRIALEHSNSLVKEDADREANEATHGNTGFRVSFEVSRDEYKAHSARQGRGDMLREREFVGFVVWAASGCDESQLMMEIEFYQSRSMVDPVLLGTAKANSLLSPKSSWLISGRTSMPCAIDSIADADEHLCLLVLHRARSLKPLDWQVINHRGHQIPVKSLLEADTESLSFGSCVGVAGARHVSVPGRRRHLCSFMLEPLPGGLLRNYRGLSTVSDGSLLLREVGFLFDHAMLHGASYVIEGSSQDRPRDALHRLPLCGHGAVTRFCSLEATPQCSNCGTLNEDLFTPFKECSGCRSVYYCGKTCQKMHWKATHKLSCSATAQASLSHQ